MCIYSELFARRWTGWTGTFALRLLWFVSLLSFSLEMRLGPAVYSFYYSLISSSPPHLPLSHSPYSNKNIFTWSLDIFERQVEMRALFHLKHCLVIGSVKASDETGGQVGRRGQADMVTTSASQISVSLPCCFCRENGCGNFLWRRKWEGGTGSYTCHMYYYYIHITTWWMDGRRGGRQNRHG